MFFPEEEMRHECRHGSVTFGGVFLLFFKFSSDSLRQFKSDPQGQGTKIMWSFRDLLKNSLNPNKTPLWNCTNNRLVGPKRLSISTESLL